MSYFAIQIYSLVTCCP